MDAIKELLGPVYIPKMISVRQRFLATRLENVGLAVREQLTASGKLQEIKHGDRIAIGVGSRGIANLGLIVRTVVGLVKERGAVPFIVPAMGSHGGATAEGQTAILAHLGITRESVGAEIRATMDVVSHGHSRGGLPVLMDANASEADGIIVVNRIKPHTSFHGTVESGLLKMLVIGFGKQRGADVAHARGFGHMSAHIMDIGEAILERLPVHFGLGVIENAFDETAKIAVVSPADFMEREPHLLREAKSMMPRILINNLHVLIVDEIGKDISGVGMDPNITGRFPNEFVQPDFHANRVAVLRLTEKSDGNAAGIGLADVTTTKVEQAMDRAKGYMNALTSTSMASPRLPMVLSSDKLAIQAALKTCLEPDRQKLRVVRIKNTLHLEHIYISEALLEAVNGQDDIEVLGPAQDMDFDDDGNLGGL